MSAEIIITIKGKKESFTPEELKALRDEIVSILGETVLLDRAKGAKIIHHNHYHPAPMVIQVKEPNPFDPPFRITC